MEEINLDWFVGFLEGEGSFSRSKDGAGYIIPSFTLAQNDEEIMRKVRKFLGFGRIYYNKHTRTWFLQVRAQAENIKLMNLLDGKLRTIFKAKQYLKWKKLVLNRTLNKRRWIKEEESKLVELIKEGLSYEEIAKIIKRTPLSVRNKNWTKFHIVYLRDKRYGENR